MMELRSALVVGCTGFVGQALTGRLISGGVATYGLVFLDRPRRATPACELIECETNSAAAIARALDGRVFDAVFHRPPRALCWTGATLRRSSRATSHSSPACSKP